MPEALFNVAEVAVGLAGFAGVAMLLGKGPGRWNPADELRIRALLQAAFGALFAALVPVGLLLGGLAEHMAIRAGAAALLLVIIAWLVNRFRALVQLDEASREVFDPGVASVILAVMVGAALAQLATVLGWTGAIGPALFFFGLLALLAYAAFNFMRLMFVRPRGE
jgi:uncharacterized Tic20 family protein